MTAKAFMLLLPRILDGAIDARAVLKRRGFRHILKVTINIAKSAMKSTIIILLTALLTLSMGSVLAAQQDAQSKSSKKIALVIGNANYQTINKLKNPVNDAKAIAKKLSQLGFQVISGMDLNRKEMISRLKLFNAQANSAELSLFYYAGHGIQSSGKNYLIPIDVELKTHADLVFEGIDFNSNVLKKMQASLARIIFLDACRDNPLATNEDAKGHKSRSNRTRRGLATINIGPNPNTIITFATGPGKVAFDGEGLHSPFAEALLKHIDAKTDIDVMMKRVRGAVARSTGQSQQPWTNSSIRDHLSLATTLGVKKRTAGTIIDRASVREISLWNSLHRDGKGTISEYQVYLQSYPKGQFAPLARSRIAPLARSRIAQLPGGTSPTYSNSTARGYGGPTDRKVRKKMTENWWLPNARTKIVADHESEQKLALSKKNWQDVQLKLKKLDFEPGRTDGIADPKTRKSIVLWQRSTGYPPSGFLNKYQYTSLLAPPRIRRYNAARKNHRTRKRKAASSTAAGGRAAGNFVGGVARGEGGVSFGKPRSRVPYPADLSIGFGVGIP